jgi:2-octaprenyl-6-methoxyphenol hydroxylase
MTLFDVVIVGGGMTGSTLALALNQHRPDLSVAIIEADAGQEGQRQGFDDRCLALSSHSLSALSNLALPMTGNSLGCSITQIQVSDRGHWGKTIFSSSEMGVSQFGSVVRLSKMALVFDQALRHLPIQRYSPAIIDSIERHMDRVDLTLSTGVSFSTRLLVCADGGHSSLLPSLGFSTVSSPTQQYGVIANVRVSSPQENAAFERFTPNGPLALLPLGKDEYSLVWCVHSDLESHLMALSDLDFLTALQTAFGWRLGLFIAVSSRSSYELTIAELSDFVSHRVVAVGNAAQRLHPIAGQGFNLALRDVLSLVSVLSENEAQDVGEMRWLSQYRSLCREDKRETLTWTSTLLHGFSNDFRPFVIGRNLGLSVMNVSSSFQRPLIKRAMGLRQLK